MRVLAVLLSLWFLQGCKAGDGSGLDQNGQPIDPSAPPPDTTPPANNDGIQPNLTSIQDEVLTPICTQCHIGSGAPLGLRMDDLATSIANLIDVDSATNPLFKRVNPNLPDESFFYLKIVGDPQAGNQMPLGQTPLSSEVQGVIRTWIENGAPIDENQLVQGKSLVSIDQDTMTLTLQFSQPIDQNTLGVADVQANASTATNAWNIDDQNKQLNWITPSKLSIQLSNLSPQVQRVEVQLNQNHLSSILSTSGNWLDGDKDGIPGGAIRYEYSIKL